MDTMNNTKINWTDVTWNPASGCTKVSTGCKYCYAETLSENKRGTLAFPDGFDMTLRPWKLDEPERLRKASLVFTNSMSDMFHPSIPDAYREKVFDAIGRAPWHRYQMLTKRPEIARTYFLTRKVPDSVWLGVTVENQDSVERIEILQSIDAEIRFLSCEPLLGKLDLDERLDGIAWVIGGGESGAHLGNPEIARERSLSERTNGKWSPRDDRYDWARSLRDTCVDSKTAFWWKQWGGTRPESSGKLIDGEIWHQLPTANNALPDASLAPIAGTRHACRKLKRVDFVESPSLSVL